MSKGRYAGYFRKALLPALILLAAFVVACGQGVEVPIVPQQQPESQQDEFREQPLNITPENRQSTAAQESAPPPSSATSSSPVKAEQPAVSASGDAGKDAAAEPDDEAADPLGDEFFLRMISPAGDPAFVKSPVFDVTGKTRVDAAVSINDDLLDVDQEGIFTSSVALEEGPNIIEVVASVNSGEPEKSMVLTIFYLP
ncbi:MAG: hypothetical protein L0177_13770 [Chloroflexi bacterium]|nr:hypothetical protein [Chloroflexota bacterium]